mmetsp:Transcript_30141/g.51265  ORF Transcript_30141/g.51265 Transcript_30141/m.51265 type:complete len:139 (-) Transcript_30141:1269-1685(-)
MVAKVPLLQFDDNSYPDELIVKLQGMDKLRAFRNRIIVPIARIESIKTAEPANIQDKRLGLVKVAGVGAVLERNRGKEKMAVNGKMIVIALRDERYTELKLKVNDVESEKVIKVLHEMLREACIEPYYQSLATHVCPN